MELIYAYTRAQAIDDGVLVDVSEVAKEAGFRFPVALTSAVWRRYVEIPTGVEAQDEQGRLWDILWMLHIAVKGGNGGSEIRFSLHVRNDNRAPKMENLKALCGPGDDFEPVITVMMPDED